MGTSDATVQSREGGHSQEKKKMTLDLLGVAHEENVLTVESMGDVLHEE